MMGSYRNAFFAAVMLHVFIVVLLITEVSIHHNQPALQASQVENTHKPHDIMEAKPEPIQAVSLDSDRVMQTVAQLKSARLQKIQAEEQRQKQLELQAQAARKKRLAEQKRLEKLKKESEKFAIERKKELEIEQRRLKELTKKKKLEEQNLAEMKRKQEQLRKQEAAKLAELEKKRSEEAARIQREREAQAKAELERKKEAQQRQAQLEADKQVRIASEVNKHKALIINAISRQWILPDNIEDNVSSQFRIRLAPSGIVLDVALTRSSGDPILDRSAQSAIYKASPLPVPQHSEAFDVFRDIRLTVRPENARG